MTSNATQHAQRAAWLRECALKLAEPLAEKAIQRTKASETRRGYDTTGYGYQWIVDRLNDVLGLDGWRARAEYEVEEYKTAKGSDMYAVTCSVTMQIGYVSGAGKWVVLAQRECHGGHDSLSLADAKKGAFTNGLKKTAALFGCGAQVFRDELDDDSHPLPEREQKARTHAGPSAPADPKWDARTKHARDRLKELAKEHGEECQKLTQGMPRATVLDLEAMIKRIEERFSKKRERTYTVDDFNRLAAKAPMNAYEMMQDLRSTYHVDHASELNQEDLNNACKRLEVVCSREDNDIPL